MGFLFVFILLSKYIDIVYNIYLSINVANNIYVYITFHKRLESIARKLFVSPKSAQKWNCGFGSRNQIELKYFYHFRIDKMDV